jgi:hypothetical protein
VVIGMLLKRGDHDRSKSLSLKNEQAGIGLP